MADDKTAQTDQSAQVAQAKLQTPTGVHDILPNDHEYFTYIKKVVRHRARQAGYRRISTPIFEYLDVFQRGIGDATDIVQKEMYSFDDRGGRMLALKPEGTAGVCRAYIEHGMRLWPQPVELYYIEPHFRYDRPQKGRFRQFWQYGFEIIGETDPALDVQMIQLNQKILSDLGIAHLFDLQLNSIGCKMCRTDYLNALKDYYAGKERGLCLDCKVRLEKNPLRLLDCKEEDCRTIASFAPKFADLLCAECKEFDGHVKEYLGELGISYTVNPQLVRGLDYYTKTVFEWWDKTLGAQNAIGGGGRYDGLVEIMGGESTPAVGFASGMERIVMHMKNAGITVPKKDDIHVFVAQLGDTAKKKCLKLISDLREQGVKTVGALGKGSMKAQLRLADKFQVQYTLILGVTEVRDGTIILRNMAKGSQKIIPFAEAMPAVIEALGEEQLDKYTPGEVVY